MEKFADDNVNKVKVVKVDVDDAPNVASKFGIKSVPSIMLFNEGQKLDMRVGLTSLSVLDNFVLQKIGS